jgi:hypothetical protein
VFHSSTSWGIRITVTCDRRGQESQSCSLELSEPQEYSISREGTEAEPAQEQGPADEFWKALAVSYLFTRMFGGCHATHLCATESLRWQLRRNNSRTSLTTIHAGVDVGPDCFKEKNAP